MVKRSLVPGIDSANAGPPLEAGVGRDHRRDPVDESGGGMDAVVRAQPWSVERQSASYDLVRHWQERREERVAPSGQPADPARSPARFDVPDLLEDRRIDEDVRVEEEAHPRRRWSVWIAWSRSSSTKRSSASGGRKRPPRIARISATARRRCSEVAPPSRASIASRMTAPTDSRPRSAASTRRGG